MKTRSTRLWCSSALAVTLGSIAGASAHAAALPPRIELTLIADEPCAPSLRQVLNEQLASVASDIVWSCRAHLDQDELLRSPAKTFAVRVWIDVSTPNDARVFIEDEPAEHFVVRRVPLANGLDEVSREEIGEIVRFGVFSILEGHGEALTPTAVRAALSSWETAPPTPKKGDAGDRPTALARPASSPKVEPATKAASPARTWGLAPEFAVAYSAQAFSRELPVVQELAVGAAVTGPSRSLFVWTEAGYQWPTTYQGQQAAVELEAMSVRLGTTFKRPAAAWGAWGFGAAVGANRIAFSPAAGTTAFAAAAPDHFFSITGRLLFTWEYQAGAHLIPGLRLFCDVATTRIHYDLREVDGTSRRVLAPFALTPGLMLVVAVRP